jgi:hypothetical protein
VQANINTGKISIATDYLSQMIEDNVKTMSRSTFNEEIDHGNEERYDLPFKLIYILTIMGSLKPEFIIPGIRDISIIRQIPNLLLGILFLLWIKKYPKVLHNKQTKFYFLFYLLIVFNTLLARNVGFALPIVKGFGAGFVSYLIVVSFINKHSKLMMILNVFILCNIPLAILGIKHGGLVESIPALSDENDFALLMNILMPLGFFLGMASKEFRKKVFYFGVTGLFIVGIIVSFSRGGFVGLLCTSVYCFLKSQKKAALTIILLIIIPISYFLVPQSYWDEMATIEQGTQEGTAATRIYLWGNALVIFANHPIFGVGPNNAGVWITTYDNTNRGGIDWGRALHSVYFTLLSELGLIGTFLFAAMIYYGEKNKTYIKNIYNSFSSLLSNISMLPSRKDRYTKQIKEIYFLSLAFTGALIGYLSSGAFLSVLYYGWFWMIMSYTVILFNITNKLLEEIAEEDNTFSAIE